MQIPQVFTAFVVEPSDAAFAENVVFSLMALTDTLPES
jgi:hypothetical protein